MNRFSISLAVLLSLAQIVLCDDPPYDNFATEFSEAFPSEIDRSDEMLDLIRDSNIRPAASAVDAATSSTEQVQIRRRHLLVQLNPKTRPDDAKRLFERLDLRLDDSTFDAGILLLYIGDETANKLETDLSIADDNQATQIQSKLIGVLKEETIVREVFHDLAIVNPASIPRQPEYPPTARSRRGMGTHYWIWCDRPDAERLKVAEAKLDANYGQIAMRLPAAWNFADAIAKQNQTPMVGVLDVGFGPHVELPEAKTLNEAQTAIHDHGNHVAGIIGAKFDGLGINGCTKHVNLLFSCYNKHRSGAGEAIVFSDMIFSLAKLIVDGHKQHQVRIINASIGFSWGKFGIDTSDPKVQSYVATMGRLSKSVLALAEQRGILVVSAAGNDSTARSTVDAKWGSPLNWAGLVADDDRPASANVIVVESLSRELNSRLLRRHVGSNVRGHISAPGEQILSALAHNQYREPQNDVYGLMSGTSQAAPHVSGVVALLWAYKPTLSVKEVKNILLQTAVPLKKAAPRIDAFAAMILAGGKEAFHDLSDLNSDNLVDARDFQIFKSALTQVETMAVEDLNGDGKITSEENFWPRADLNGEW